MKELAENGHRLGSTPLLTNDENSWPGMGRTVSCNHLFPSLERERSSAGLGAVWLGDEMSPWAS